MGSTKSRQHKIKSENNYEYCMLLMPKLLDFELFSSAASITGFPEYQLPH
jgi:hypothetical protein